MHPDPENAFGTKLGFGCNNLLGDKTREQGLALLYAALDAGVSHFDVGRYYGYGDAEGLVGEFLHGRRNQVTITTKFGLQPIKAISKAKPMISVARRLMRSSSFARKLVRRGVHNLVQRGLFDRVTAEASLETSLRELRTDCIDVWLMHEPSVADCTEETHEFIRRARDAGKIRYFGTGAEFTHTMQILEQSPAFAQVVQFDSDILNSHVQQVAAIATMGAPPILVIHGVMAPLGKLLERFKTDERLRRDASQIVQRDVADPETLAGVLLAHAVMDNPVGCVLFRSVSPRRIVQNVTAVNQAPPKAQLHAFAELCRSAVAGTVD